MSDSPQRVPIAPVTFDRAHWSPKHPQLFSRRQVEQQTGEYAAAIPASIADASLVLEQELATDIEDATLELQRFDTFARMKLGNTNPALGPMSSILLRTESSSSSQIENLTTSAKQLALTELGVGKKTNALTVIGNVRAMEAALRLADRLDAPNILTMHFELLSRHRGMEEHAGTFRDDLVWVGGSDAGPIGADFVAPQPARVAVAIDDLVSFMNRNDVPVLAQVAVAHAQFETIHPFADGNGRTGRAIAQSMLRNKGLSTHTTVPISAGILTDTARYFSALNDYRAGDAGAIIRVFTRAARYAAVTGRTLVERLHEELEQAQTKLAKQRPDSIAWQVLPLLIGQPVVNTQYLRETLGINSASAIRTLDTLTTRGVLVERTGQARNRVWEHPRILNALDDYARGLLRSQPRP